MSRFILEDLHTAQSGHHRPCRLKIRYKQDGYPVLMLYDYLLPSLLHIYSRVKVINHVLHLLFVLVISLQATSWIIRSTCVTHDPHCLGVVDLQMAGLHVEVFLCLVEYFLHSSPVGSIVVRIYLVC